MMGFCGFKIEFRLEFYLDDVMLFVVVVLKRCVWGKYLGLIS